MRIAIETDRRTATALVLSALQLVLVALAGGRQAFLGVLVYLPLPWLFLRYPDELGAWSHGVLGGRGTGVNRPTPGRFVSLMGWLLLVAPAIYCLAVFA